MKKIIFALVFLFLTITLSAQQLEIRGTVVDNSNTPWPGVTIVIKGTKIGTQTNFDGEFSIKAKKGDKLVLSSVGLKTKEFKVKADLKPTIKLQEERTVCFAELSYYLPFKIHEFWADDLVSQNDLYNRLRTNVPGIQITNTLGGKSPKITMRGESNTIVIIDGVRYNDTSILNTLNPSDIEKVYVANSPAAEQYLLTKRN